LSVVPNIFLRVSEARLRERSRRSASSVR